MANPLDPFRRIVNVGWTTEPSQTQWWFRWDIDNTIHREANHLIRRGSSGANTTTTCFGNSTTDGSRVRSVANAGTQETLPLLGRLIAAATTEAGLVDGETNGWGLSSTGDSFSVRFSHGVMHHTRNTNATQSLSDFTSTRLRNRSGCVAMTASDYQIQLALTNGSFWQTDLTFSFGGTDYVFDRVEAHNNHTLESVVLSSEPADYQRLIDVYGADSHFAYVTDALATRKLDTMRIKFRSTYST